MGSSNCKSKKAKGHKLNSPLQSGSLDRPFPRANSIPIQPNKVISDVLLNEKKFHQQHIDENYQKIPNLMNENNGNQVLEFSSYEEETFGLVGLTNLGNTCFMNTTFQLLSNTQPLADYFIADLHTKEINKNSKLGSEGVVTNLFADLIKDLWSVRETSIKPYQIIRCFKLYGPRFANNSQEDSQEFLTFLLDVIHEDLNRVKLKRENEKLRMQGSVKFTGGISPLEIQAAEEWKKYLKINRSIVVDLFQGQIKNTITCLSCKKSTNIFDPIMYLSLPVPTNKKTVDLSDCFLEFTKKETLNKSEGWKCSNCLKISACTKEISIWKIPNILIIHFKRFNYTQYGLTKLQSFIDFPINDFDLTNFTDSSQKDKPIYNLFGVANHVGDMHSGHYFAFCKNDENKKWFLFNDAVVSEIENPAEEIVTPNAYLLFYAKTSVDYFMRQTLSAPQLWPHIVEFQEGLMKSKSIQRKQSSTGFRENLRYTRGTSVLISKGHENISLLQPESIKEKDEEK